MITSVAGDRGRPRNYTYGAAKSATTTYLEGVRSRLYRAGVTVHDLRLGPVDTPMTRDHPKNALFGEPAGALDYRWMRAVLPDMLVGHGYHMGEESPALRRSRFG